MPKTIIKREKKKLDDFRRCTIIQILIASGIIIAFLSFALIQTITSGVLIYIAQAFTAGGAIFGVSIYFKNQLIEARGETINKVKELIEDVVKDHLEAKY